MFRVKHFAYDAWLVEGAAELLSVNGVYNDAQEDRMHHKSRDVQKEGAWAVGCAWISRSPQIQGNWSTGTMKGQAVSRTDNLK